MNPFSKGRFGVGPGPGDLAAARIRALSVIVRRAELEHAKKELKRPAARERDQAASDADLNDRSSPPP